MMTLFAIRGSCSFASHVTLEESGAKYGVYYVNADANEQHTPDYLKINPKGKVPVLKVSGKIITENVAIQYYIAQRFPEKKLCPLDIDCKMEWLSFISWISNTVQPDARHVARPEVYSDEPTTFPAIREKGKVTFSKWLREFDKRLENGSWMMGDQFTTADPYALVFVGVAKRLKISLTEFENCAQWVRRMRERPAVRKVLELEESPILDMD